MLTDRQRVENCYLRKDITEALFIIE